MTIPAEIIERWAIPPTLAGNPYLRMGRDPGWYCALEHQEAARAAWWIGQQVGPGRLACKLHLGPVVQELLQPSQGLNVTLIFLRLPDHEATCAEHGVYLSATLDDDSKTPCPKCEFEGRLTD